MWLAMLDLRGQEVVWIFGNQSDESSVAASHHLPGMLQFRHPRGVIYS